MIINSGNKNRIAENEPLISVIIPAYQAARYIRQSVESILNQTYSNTEIIIIDDASTDGTVEIVSSVFCEYLNSGKIKLIRNPLNMKKVFSCNKASEFANGKYLLLFDCDDILLPAGIRKMYDVIIKKNADVVNQPMKAMIDSNGNLMFKRTIPFPGSNEFKIFINFVSNSCILLKKDIFEKVGKLQTEFYGFNPVFADDILLLCRLYSYGAKVVISRFGEYIYRQHSQSVTKTTNILEGKTNSLLPIFREWHKDGIISNDQLAIHIFGFINFTSMKKWPRIFSDVLKASKLFFLRYPISPYYILIILYWRIIDKTKKKIINILK